MFKKKVGSDACLVLDAVATLASTTVTYTVTQKFDFEDVLKASETRAVKCRVTTADATLKAAFGDVNIASVAAFDSTNKRIYIAADSLAGALGVAYISKNADTGVWSGTITLS